VPPQHGRVVVVGSVNVDLVMRLPALPRAGQTVLGGELARSDGGKGANQAVAAARAGAWTHLIGAVGVHDGGQSVAALAAEGVHAAGVDRVEASTGHAFVLVDDRGENQIAVASGANSGLSPGHVLAALGDLRLTTADVIVLSFEVPAAALRAAASAATTAGCQLVVNPGPARPRSLDLLAGAIATPNVHELATLAESLASTELADRPDPEPGATAIALARHTGGVVVVTLGPDGALVADPGRADAARAARADWAAPLHALHVPGHRVAVRDTTGAGDTFTGVLAASLAAGQDLTTSVRRAVAASALAVTADGARAGMPATAEIDALLARA
jgi:ribokinase